MPLVVSESGGRLGIPFGFFHGTNGGFRFLLVPPTGIVASIDAVGRRGGITASDASSASSLFLSVEIDSKSEEEGDTDEGEPTMAGALTICLIAAGS